MFFRCFFIDSYHCAFAGLTIVSFWIFALILDVSFRFIRKFGFEDYTILILSSRPFFRDAYRLIALICLTLP